VVADSPEHGVFVFVAGSCCCRSGADFEKEAGKPLFFIYTLLSVGSVVGAIYMITHSDDLVMPEAVEDSSVVSRPDQKAESREQRAESRAEQSRDQTRAESRPEQRAESRPLHRQRTSRGLPTDGERKPAERFSDTLTDTAVARRGVAWRGVAGCV
jgi:hypothetical protein